MRSACLPSPTRPRWVLCLTLLLAAGTLPARAQFQHYTYNGEVTIERYTGSGGAVVIPSRINGRPVTTIGPSAFEYCNSLTSVSIPTSIKKIGDNAFSDCNSLTSVTIPYRVREIGNNAFNSCGSLVNAMIGRGVTNLGMSVFNGCMKLNAITVDAANPAYSSLAGVLFNKRKTRLIHCPSLKAGAYALPASVVHIESGAFSNCELLTHVAMGARLARIESGSFGNCPRLTAFTVDSRNPALRSVNGVLFNKRRTTLLQYPGGKTGSYAIPAGVTNIGPQSFSWSFGLTGVTIPNSVTHIEDSAFWLCPRLPHVAIPNSVTTVGQCAFWDCASLSRVTFGTGLTHLGYDVFWNCPRLSHVYFKGNAPRLEGSLFQGAPRVTVHYLPWRTGWRSTFSGRPARAWDTFEPDNSMAAAKPIGNGQRQTRCIAPAGNEDWAKFTVRSSGARNVQVETSGTRGDTQMWLYRANGQLVAYNDNSGPGLFSRISRPSLPPGTYFIRIREHGNDGRIPAYTLRATWTTP